MKNLTMLMPADPRGCGFYRILQPGRVFAKSIGSKAIETCHLPRAEEWGRYKFDLVLTQRQFEVNQYRHWCEYSARHPDLPIYMDFDDLLWAPHPGSTFKLSRDRVQCMDKTVQFARHLVASTHDMADALWDRYRREAFVLPNMISEREFRTVRARENGQKLRVIWAGGNTHAPDLHQIIPVVQSTTTKYEWVFFGFVPDALKGIVKVAPETEMKDYLRSVHAQGAHVGIAPLLDIPFNRCKSHLKILEYGALGLPTIATDIAPYKDSPGILIKKPRVSDWLRALSVMEDENTRMEIADKCQEYSRSYCIERPENISIIQQAYGHKAA
ncbi:glycosyltransferase family protein [Komagataeibacter oboediens]|uniref:hypothetical protein n=1 Tax=Komagataeibacter oboediens TaxID=65958 RepID=UPI0012F482F6|nr:hypothetical protein [Komagataeibacter oboediens]